MENKKRLNYERIAKIVGIIIGLILVFGISYAVFKTVTRSEQTNTISAGKLDVQIENEQDEILIEKAYPITEEEGLKQNPYTFEIVNKGSINAEYDLYIEIEENTTLPTEVVRYYLTVEEEGQEKIVTEKARLITQEETTEREGKRLYKIDTKYLDTTKTNKYKLYLWIDYEATKEEASNKYFEARIVVDSVQIYDKNRLVKQVDVSASGDNSVLAYMYADGTVYLKGKGTIASNLSDTIGYEKEGVLNNYKKVLIQMGCNAEEVNAITSIEELNEYMNNFTEEEWNNFYVVLYKETLEEMGHDTSSITDMDSLMTYLTEKGYIDENGEATESGDEFFTKFNENYDNKYSTDPIPATKIVLEDGIENIPNGLYTGNEAITEVRIPASVKSIADSAFYGCRGLTEIVIPDSVISIGSSAFSNCTNLTKMMIPNNVTSIGPSTFNNCTNLTSLTIPDSVTSIGYYAFQNCTSLTSVNIPDSVTSIGNYAFSNCSSLTRVDMPDNLTSVGDYAFQNCISLTNITIPNSMTSIGQFVFRYCRSLKSINIPASITSIEAYAFEGCSSLTNLTIPNSVTSIGTDAFSGCTSLTEMEIPNSVTSMGTSPFSGCTGIKKLTIDGTKNYGNLGMRNIEELIITGTGNMFNYVSVNYQPQVPWYSSRDSIKKVTLSDTFTSIGQNAFKNCSSLTEIEIPDSVVSIGGFAFYGCTGLTEIILPENVTSIGNSAFYKCSSLKEFKIPSGVTSIENYTFEGCSSLTEIEIPNSVTSIGTSAFSGCIGIKKLTIDGTKDYRDLWITNIENLVITGNGNMYNYSISSGKTPWYSSRASIKSVTLSNSLTSIGTLAFYECTNLPNITIPNSVTSIGGSAFFGCTSLTEITISNSVTSIGGSAFYECTNLPNITIPNSVTSIGNLAFDRCTSLTQINVDENNNNYASIDGVLFNKEQTTIIKFPEGKNNISYAIPSFITEIGEWAFSNCKNLVTLEIPTSVIRIEDFAFSNCTNIKEITIPNSVEYAGMAVFDGWTSNQAINIDNTEAYVNANWANTSLSGSSVPINYLRS